jgi:PIN domain nuclease of toxin-antitoxin system
MLIAQSLAEPLRLLTHDHRLAQYGEMVLTV